MIIIYYDRFTGGEKRKVLSTKQKIKISYIFLSTQVNINNLLIFALKCKIVQLCYSLQNKNK